MILGDRLNFSTKTQRPSDKVLKIQILCMTSLKTHHYLLNKYLSVYYVPGTILGSGDIVGSKRQGIGPIRYWGLHNLGRG